MSIDRVTRLLVWRTGFLVCLCAGLLIAAPAAASGAANADSVAAGDIAPDASAVDPAILRKAMSAPPEVLARGYRATRMMLSMLPLAEAGATLQLSGRKVTRSNAARVRRELEARLAAYDVAITRRGRADIAGEYRAEAPGCRECGSPWATIIAKGFSKVVVTEEGPGIELTAYGEHEGKALDLSASGYIVEDAIVVTDPMNSDYDLIGRVHDGQVEIRPDVDQVLKAWPAWAHPPKRADVESCLITLRPVSGTVPVPAKP